MRQSRHKELLRYPQGPVARAEKLHWATMTDYSVTEIGSLDSWRDHFGGFVPETTRNGRRGLDHELKGDVIGMSATAYEPGEGAGYPHNTQHIRSRPRRRIKTSSSSVTWTPIETSWRSSSSAFGARPPTPPRSKTAGWLLSWPMPPRNRPRRGPRFPSPPGRRICKDKVRLSVRPDEVISYD